MTNPVGNSKESVEAKGGSRVRSELEDEIVAQEKDEEETSLDWIIVDKPTVQEQPKGPPLGENGNGGGKHAISMKTLEDSVESEISGALKMPDKKSSSETAAAVKDLIKLSPENFVSESETSETLKMPAKKSSSETAAAAKGLIKLSLEKIPVSESEISDALKPPAKKSSSETAAAAKGIDKLSLEKIPLSESDDRFPLDGLWNMVWISHPENSTPCEVKNHMFEVMGCQCDIICSKSSDGKNYASFYWPEVLSENLDTVYQESKHFISPGDISIEWRTSDQQYGDMVWYRMDPVGCVLEPEEKKLTTMKDNLYPLDGIWVVNWKSYCLDPSLIMVFKNKFELFDCPCEIEFKLEDNLCPSVQWPVAIFSEATPIFQKGKKSILENLEVSEWPSIVEWTVTDKQYGEVTWTRFNPKESIASHIVDQKRQFIDKDEEETQKRREDEEKKMKSSIPGKAWDLVKAILVLSSQIDDIEPIAKDDVIYLAERLLEAQKGLKESNLPWTVDIAYHHTQSINLKTIKTDGLLSRAEREKRGIRSKFNGSSCGDGIYCSEDPVQYARNYGDTTIMFARMKGFSSTQKYADCNTFMAPNFCVLKSCNQCIPLFQFKSALLGRPLLGRRSFHQQPQDRITCFREKLAVFQKLVQVQLNQIVNDNITTEVYVPWATLYDIQPPKLAFIDELGSILSYDAPESLDDTFCKPSIPTIREKCPICGDSFKTPGKIVKVGSCGHVFHIDCILKSMEAQSCCPVCSLPISPNHWRGKMPSGTMTVSKIRSNRSGIFASDRPGDIEFPTFVLDYDFPPGVQKMFHPNPSHRYSSGQFRSYLPASADGTRLLKRLKFAFSRGLLFSISPDNSILPMVRLEWTKPDPWDPNRDYIRMCNAKLDLLHVPSALKLSKKMSLRGSKNDAVSTAGQQPSSPPLVPKDPSTASDPAPYVEPLKSLDPYMWPNNRPTPIDYNLPVAWQSDDDLPDRRKITVLILELLKTKVVEGTALYKRLPNMAKNIEERLYRNGHSKEGYMNAATLKLRVEQMGIGIFAKPKFANPKRSTKKKGWFKN